MAVPSTHYDYAACPPDVELVRLQRSGDGRSVVWDDHPASVLSGLSLERITDETTILNFRDLPEKQVLATGFIGHQCSHRRLTAARREKRSLRRLRLHRGGEARRTRSAQGHLA